MCTGWLLRHTSPKYYSCVLRQLCGRLSCPAEHGDFCAVKKNLIPADSISRKYWGGCSMSGRVHECAIINSTICGLPVGDGAWWPIWPHISAAPAALTNSLRYWSRRLSYTPISVRFIKFPVSFCAHIQTPEVLHVLSGRFSRYLFIFTFNISVNNLEGSSIHVKHTARHMISL